MQKRNPSIVKLGCIAAALLATPVLAFAADAGDFQKSFEEANHHYDEGKFAEAEQGYQSLVKDGHYSPQLFYNLGNTEFRLQKTGAAILNYERAEMLAPGNPEVQANLAYVRTQAGVKTPDKTWRDNYIVNIGANHYSIIAAIAGWILVFSIGALLFKPQTMRGMLRVAALFSIAVLGWSIFAIVQLEKRGALAIVTTKQTEARFAPADNSTLAATLPMGSRVWILEARGPWTHCRMPDQSTAWISSDSIERVRMQDS